MCKFKKKKKNRIENFVKAISMKTNQNDTNCKLT